MGSISPEGEGDGCSRRDRRPPRRMPGTWPTRAKIASRRCLPWPEVWPRTAGSVARPRAFAPRPGKARSSEANALDVAEAGPGLGLNEARRSTASRLDPKRLEAIADQPGRGRRLARPHRRGHVRVVPPRPNGLEVIAGPRPPGRDLHDLREPTECHRRRRRRSASSRGNAAILRGGKEAAPDSNQALAPDLGRRAGPRAACRSIRPSNWSTTTDRSAVGHLLGMPGPDRPGDPPRRGEPDPPGREPRPKCRS